MAKVKDIEDMVGRIIGDNTHVRWTTSEMRKWIWDGILQIINVRPDAYSVTRTVQLNHQSARSWVSARGSQDSGVVTDNPTYPVRLLRVIANWNVGQSRPSSAIRIIPRTVLDTEIPGWHRATDIAAKHYTFDNLDPSVFYAYPHPAQGDAQRYALVVHTSVPDPLSDENSPIGIGDQFVGAIVDWVCHRAYSKDAEYAGNGARAEHHKTMFFTALEFGQLAEFTASDPGAATPLPAGRSWARSD